MMAAVWVRLFLSGAQTVGLCCNRLSNVQHVSGQAGTEAVDGTHPGSHLGADPPPESPLSHAAPTDATLPTCGNAVEAGSLPSRTSFGTKRSWVQIPPPRQRSTRSPGYSCE
jgi:hypothetical protein